jgi:RNA polymerase sigma factor (sigma-70 family)
MNNLLPLIRACRQQDRLAQKQLYCQFYNYGMTLCCRYAPNMEEAKEILNDAFVKIFSKIDHYDESLSFSGWIHRIIVNTAIDFYRKHRFDEPVLDLVHAQYVDIQEDMLAAMSTKEIMNLVQQLTPSYRIVFNLHVVEGYAHEEIATMLQISVGTSKSNLARAKLKLQQLILKQQGFFQNFNADYNEGKRFG